MMLRRSILISAVLILLLSVLSRVDASYLYTEEIGKGTSYLISHQNPDGGWGGAPSGASTVYDTCFAIWTICDNISYPATPIQNAKNYLLNQRNASGVWSSVITTAMATMTLSRVFDETNSTTIEWILSAQLDEGTWSGHTSEGCALIATWLMLSGVPSNDTHIAKSVNYIISQQQPDYLWGGVGAAVPGRIITALGLACLNATMNSTVLEPAINAMLKFQRLNGAFYSSSPGTTDIYATMWAISSLMTCGMQVKTNITIMQKVDNATAWVITQQGAGGGFIDPFNGYQEAPGTTCQGVISLAVAGGQPLPYGVIPENLALLWFLPVTLVIIALAHVRRKGEA